MLTQWCWVLALFLASATPAAAQGADCLDAEFTSYVRSIAPTFACREVERGSSAGVDFRILTTANIKAKALSPYREMMSDILAHSLTVWGAARGFKARPVRFILFPEGRFVGDGAKGLALAFNRKLGPKEECVIAVDLERIEEVADEFKQTTNMTDLMGLTIAHELAHCVQGWGWRDRTMARTAHWWTEGTAELLGAVAYPKAIDIFRRRYPLFKKTAATVPLTRMEEESVVFFQWIWNKRHADIFNFMDAMPACADETCSTVTEDAERKATIAFLGKAQGGEGGARIQVFAQDFVDNAIPNAAGAPVGPPDPAPKQLVSDTAEVPIGGAPWTIQTRDLTVAKGDYTALEFSMLQSARARDASFPAPWGDLPHKIRPGCDGQAQFKLAFVPLNATAAKAHYRLEKRASCEKVAKAAGVCPTGEWSVDQAGHKAMLASWIGKDGRVDSVTGAIDFTFGADGVAHLEARDFTANMTPTLEIPSHVSVSVSGVDQGPWTIKGGQLSFVGGKGLLSATVKVAVGPISRTMKDQFLFERGSIYDYSCEPGALTLRYAGPRAVPADRRPTWRLVRKAP